MKKLIGIGFLIIITLFIHSKIKNNTCPLIPREVFFGNDERKLNPQISPNGAWLAYSAPVNKVMNIWLRDLNHYTKDMPLTSDNDRGIINFIWSYDNQSLYYLQDQGGNENWKLYGITLNNHIVIDYTPFENVQVRIVDYNKNYPDRMLIEINKRDSNAHDIYELNLKNAELNLLEKNPGRVIRWITDNELRVKAKLQLQQSGGYDLYVKNASNNSWRLLKSWSFEENQPQFHFISKDGTLLYAYDSQGNNTSRLVTINMMTGDTKTLYSDKTYDIEGPILLDQDTLELLGFSYNQDRIKWVFLNPEIENTFAYIRQLDDGDIIINSITLDNNTWVVAFIKDIGPATYWLFDRVQKKGTFLFDHQPLYKHYTLSAMQPITYQARDGLTIHAYLTLPCTYKGEKVPLVLRVHGGPWERTEWGLNPEGQWFASRGYAVLQVDYRGSTGYGKAFVHAGDKQWGRSMQNDLTDAVHWAINSGIADPKHIAIYGTSYGGYAALSGAAFTPELYCCAVDTVGPSNIITLLNAAPSYLKVMLDNIYLRVGHPEKDKEYLEAVSPALHVENIKIPLLIAHGANDSLVKQAESEQIVAELKKKKMNYQYLLFADEGHGLVKPQNKLKFYKVAEKFLAQHLGGRNEL